MNNLGLSSLLFHAALIFAYLHFILGERNDKESQAPNYRDHQRDYYYRTKCQMLAAPANGNFTIERRYKAIYFCNRGYSLIGQKMRTCQRNGKWSGKEPTCKIVDCESPHRADPNGIVEYESTTYLSIAVYYCNDTFQLDSSNGKLQITVCGANGMWTSTAAPSCIRLVDCGWTSPPRNGYVTYDSYTTVGSVARFSCRRGYELTGHRTRRCRINGVWSFGRPTCERIKCPKLKSSKNLEISVSGYNVGDHASLLCSYGLRLKKHLICQRNGKWSGIEPHCI